MLASFFEASKIDVQVKQTKQELQSLYEKNAYKLFLDDEPQQNQKLIEINELIKISLESQYINTLLQKDTIILAPGRSPQWHACALKVINPNLNIFSFSYSGSPYLKQVYENESQGKIWNKLAMPTIKELKNMRKFLVRQNINPNKILGYESIFILDYVCSGRGIYSLIMFLAHWLHDLKNSETTAAKSWVKKHENNNFFLELKQKIKILNMSDKTFSPKNLQISDIEAFSVCFYREIISNLAEKRYYCLVPSLDSFIWGLPIDVLEKVKENIPKQALLVKLQLEEVCKAVNKVINEEDYKTLLQSKIKINELFDTIEPAISKNQEKLAQKYEFDKIKTNLL